MMQSNENENYENEINFNGIIYGRRNYEMIRK